MLTVLFVHGTGTREPAYSLMLERIRTRFVGLATVKQCYWGQTEGARLRADGASIPQYDATRTAFSSPLDSIRLDDSQDYEIALWGLLLVDPLIELRLLEVTTRNSGELGLGQAPAVPRFNCLSNLDITRIDNDELRRVFAAGGVSNLIPKACQIVKQSTPVLDEAGSVGEQTWQMLARAVLATAFLLAQESDQPSPARTDPDLRDRLVNAIARLLDPHESVGAISSRNLIGNHFVKPVLGLATYAVASAASIRMRRRRGAISDAASAIAGDVLLYQARGTGIRRFIREQIEACEGNVVLLAHSFGGVACVDLLVLQKVPQVSLLVTVGSQAPFFYEIGALQSLEFANVPADSRLPNHFPRWLNFYDLRDFLSYVGQTVFGRNRVEDIQADNRLPFPDSHGGYFSNPQVWEKMVASL